MRLVIINIVIRLFRYYLKSYNTKILRLLDFSKFNVIFKNILVYFNFYTITFLKNSKFLTIIFIRDKTTQLKIIINNST